MSTTARSVRTTEPTCPSWCAGHGDIYQAWDDLLGDHGQRREHSEETTSIGCVEVAPGQTEHEGGTFEVPVVDIYINGDGRLSEHEARALAAVLTMMADRLAAERQVQR